MIGLTLELLLRVEIDLLRLCDLLEDLLDHNSVVLADVSVCAPNDRETVVSVHLWDWVSSRDRSVLKRCAEGSVHVRWCEFDVIV